MKNTSNFLKLLLISLWLGFLVAGCAGDERTQSATREMTSNISSNASIVAILPSGEASPAPSAMPNPSPQPQPPSSTPTPTPIIAPIPTSASTQPAGGPNNYIGWAYNAYPDTSYADMVRDVTRIKQAGANVLWISHANPATPFKQEREVGLNPAVLDAYRDFGQFAHDDAVEIVESQKNMLRACREVGIKVVLSIGYHTQMGLAWSKRNPDHLRRTPDGKIWQVTNGTEPYASIYSPVFQRDLLDYYRWIDKEYVTPYSDIIMMLNLADEPMGGDYSSWAENEFKQRTGFGFAETGNDPTRQQSLGRFQAGMIVDFMKQGAGYWQALRPTMAVTMSFDGGAMREDNGLPNLEALFRETPPNFVLTWDMYPRDRGSLEVAVNEADISRLIYLVRTIGGYSAQYGRKVWMWSAANSWGLGQDVSDPGTIADAQANLIYLAQLMTQTGGKLEGLAVWNYNIKLQGLYNYSFGSVKKQATWNEDEMFERVSRYFAIVRQIMSESGGGPQMVVLRSPEWQYRQIGAGQLDLNAKQIDYAQLDVLARNNIVTVEVGHWPEQIPASWAAMTTVAVFSPPEYLTEADLNSLRKWVAEGGTLLAPLSIAQLISGQPGAVWSGIPMAQSYGKGRIFASREPVYTLFDSLQAERLKPFWRVLLGLEDLRAAYLIRTRTSYLYYNIAKTLATADRAPGDWPVMWYHRPDGRTQPYLPNGGPVKLLQRSEFIFSIK